MNFRSLGWTGILCFAMASSAGAAPVGKEQFCAGAPDPTFFKKMASDPRNRLAFKNPSGTINEGGQCWWHSRLQRSALYLAVFRPDLPKPATREEARKIIDSLARNKRVTEIPGYSNLHQFSKEWVEEFKEYMRDWERRDVLLKQYWVRSLRSSTASKETMKKRMDELYQRVEGEKQVTYIMVRYPGWLDDVHALLVYGMKKVGTGYDIQVINSNVPTDIVTLPYRYDEPWLQPHQRKGPIYIQQNRDLKKFPKLHRKYCE